MAKKLEEELADYLLSLQRGPWMRQYARECIRLWREKYGAPVAEKAAALVREQLKE